MLFCAPGVPLESVPVYAAQATLTFAPELLTALPCVGCVRSRDGPVPSVLDNQPLFVSVVLLPSS